MIYAYGITTQGTYHIKNSIVCQDSHEIVKCSDEIVIAAVADGLGSSEHSKVASSIAAKTSTSHCKDNIIMANSTNDILDTIKASFSIAQQAIEKEAKVQGHDLNQYDTTLTLAVMAKGSLFFGHSGDSGIVALTSEGLYEKVTEQQRDEDNHVFPLFFEDRWVFGKYDREVCSVLLATDGMLEPLFPSLIKDENVNIHIHLARFLMDNRSLCIDSEGESTVRERIEKFILNIPDEQVNDDKTIVVLVDSSTESKLQPDDYYKEPDWAELKRKRDEEWKRIAYPHLFKGENTEKPQDNGALNIGASDDKIEDNISQDSKTTNEILSENTPTNPFESDTAETKVEVASQKKRNGLMGFMKK